MSHPLALIVGAGPGLGLAIARRFTQEDFRLALIVRPSDLEALRTECPKAVVIGADLGEAKALDQALLEVQAQAGFPDVLIFNAASGTRGSMATQEAEWLRRDFQVNILAPLACVQWVLPAMLAQGQGTVLFSGGGLALQPKPGEGAPALGKAAQRSLALSLAEELAPQNIHAALVTIAGFLQPQTPFSPAAVAESFWQLHQEEKAAWRTEVILKP